MSKSYYLSLSFSCGEIWKIEEEIEKVLGNCDGSGYGFGARDMSYRFNNKQSLLASVRKVRRMPRRIKCEAWDISVEDDEKEVSLRGIR